MEKQWRKNNKKSRRHVVSRRGVVGDQEKGTSASNFYIFQNKHHRCFFSHRKRQHTKGNMAGNTTWHRHAWGLAATSKPPQCRKNGAYMVINFHFSSTRELVFFACGLVELSVVARTARHFAPIDLVNPCSNHLSNMIPN